MVKEDLLGKMVHTTKETLQMVISMDLEDIILLTQINITKENSAKATWKVKVQKLGQMDAATKEILRMAKKMGKELSSGHLG